MSEYKNKQEAEARELMKNQKKIMKKERKETRKAAELEVKKMRAEREAKENKTIDNHEVIEDDPIEVEIKKENLINCSHSPQCFIREPNPPPYGPKTYN